MHKSATSTSCALKKSENGNSASMNRIYNVRDDTRSKKDWKSVRKSKRSSSRKNKSCKSFANKSNLKKFSENAKKSNDNEKL